MSTTRTLIAQTEQHWRGSPYYFGFEVFDVDGDFVLIVHTRTYDGIKVESHYACPEVRLDSLSKEAALQEAARKTTAYAKSVLNVEEPEAVESRPPTDRDRHRTQGHKTRP